MIRPRLSYDSPFYPLPCVRLCLASHLHRSLAHFRSSHLPVYPSPARSPASVQPTPHAPIRPRAHAPTPPPTPPPSPDILHLVFPADEPMSRQRESIANTLPTSPSPCRPVALSPVACRRARQPVQSVTVTYVDVPTLTALALLIFSPLSAPFPNPVHFPVSSRHTSLITIKIQ